MGDILKITEKDKYRFEITNKTETEAEILFYGAIGKSYWDDDAISEKDVINELKKLPKTIKNISIRFNSPGGDVFSGTTIYELLKNHPAKVTAYVEGLAASIASVILMAADEIVMGEGALIMIHKPLVGIYGNADELQRMMDILNKIENQMISIYSKRMSASKTEIAKMLSDETWLNADEAIESGLADRKFDEGDESRYLAASYIQNHRSLKNAPRMDTTTHMLKERVKSLTNDVKLFLNNTDNK